MLLMLIIFCSSTGRSYDEMFDGPPKSNHLVSDSEEEDDLPCSVSNGYIELLTNLLLVENFLKAREVSRGQIDMYNDYIRLFLRSYKQVVNRETGMGMKIIKFHLPLHGADDMERFGPSMSFDGSNGESGHIPMKQAARSTQQNSLTFDAQTARQHSQNLMIDRAHRFLHPPPSLLPDESLQSRGVAQPCTFRGFSYYVSKEGMFVHQAYTKKRKEPVPALWPDEALQKRVVTLITNCVLPFVATGSVMLFTELKWTRVGTIFRANPSYGKYNNPWHDWANIDWSPDGTASVAADIVPARLVIYFQIPVRDFRTSGITEPLEYFPLKGAGYFAIVESLVESLYQSPTTKHVSYTGADKELSNYLAHPVCGIIYWSMTETLSGTIGGVPKLRVVPIRAFSKTCVAIPYNIENVDSGEWLIIAPFEDWSESFLDEMKLRLKNEKATVKRKRAARLAKQKSG